MMEAGAVRTVEQTNPARQRRSWAASISSLNIPARLGGAHAFVAVIVSIEGDRSRGDGCSENSYRREENEGGGDKNVSDHGSPLEQASMVH